MLSHSFLFSSGLSLCFCVAISNLEILLNRKDGKIYQFIFSSFVYSKVPIEKLLCSRHSCPGVNGHRPVNVKQVHSQIHRPQLYYMLYGNMQQALSLLKRSENVSSTIHSKPSPLRHEIDMCVILVDFYFN